MIYFLSCEGETERWYFEWLKKQINNDPRVNCQLKCNSQKDFDQTNLVVYGNVKPSWVWRLKAPDSFLVLQDSLLRGFVPLGKIHARVRSGSRSFLSAMHSTGRQNTYHSAGLSLSPSNRQPRCLAGIRLYRFFGKSGKCVYNGFGHRFPSFCLKF